MIRDLKYYDFIIIGAGSTGAVLAKRLTDNPKVNVLLLEAGKKEHFYAQICNYAHVFSSSHAH